MYSEEVRYNESNHFAIKSLFLACLLFIVNLCNCHAYSLQPKREWFGQAVRGNWCADSESNLVQLSGNASLWMLECWATTRGTAVASARSEEWKATFAVWWLSQCRWSEARPELPTSSIRSMALSRARLLFSSFGSAKRWNKAKRRIRGVPRLTLSSIRRTPAAGGPTHRSEAALMPSAGV